MPCSLSISLFERQSLSSMLHVLLFSLKVLCRVLCFTSFVHLHSFYNLTLLVNLSIENKKLVTILSLFSISPYLTFWQCLPKVCQHILNNSTHTDEVQYILFNAVYNLRQVGFRSWTPLFSFLCFNAACLRLSSWLDLCKSTSSAQHCLDWTNWIQEHPLKRITSQTWIVDFYKWMLVLSAAQWAAGP